MLVFLTGPVQVGKSTAIRRYLAGCPEQPGGFWTGWDAAGNCLVLTLPETGEQFAVARRTPSGVAADPGAFDAAGARLLALGAARPLLLMDELGFLERDAAIFRRAVETLLDSGRPVLGVLRDRPDNVFRPLLLRRRDAVILPVSEASRDGLPARIASLLDAAPACAAGKEAEHP